MIDKLYADKNKLFSFCCAIGLSALALALALMLLALLTTLAAAADGGFHAQKLRNRLYLFPGWTE